MSALYPYSRCPRGEREAVTAQAINNYREALNIERGKVGTLRERVKVLEAALRTALDECCGAEPNPACRQCRGFIAALAGE